MKRHLFPLTVVMALAIAGPAWAKEVSKVKVCGTSGCQETSDKQLLAGFGDGGSSVGPPKSRSPFYNVTLTVRAGDAHDTWTIAYLPSQNLIRTQDPADGQAWLRPDAKTAALYAKLIGTLQAFPASRLPKIHAPTATVDEVITPPAPHPPVAGDDASGFPWLVLILGGGGFLVLAAAIGGRRRRRTRRASPASPAPTPAS
jgi:hypothetical protein